MPARYRYTLRPAYGSGELLIEIFRGADQETFFTDLLKALEAMQPRVKKRDDSWVSDEFVYHFDSAAGAFSLHIDTWGLGFIMAEANSGAVPVIDRLLQTAPDFEKSETPS